MVLGLAAVVVPWGGFKENGGAVAPPPPQSFYACRARPQITPLRRPGAKVSTRFIGI